MAKKTKATQRPSRRVSRVVLRPQRYWLDFLDAEGKTLATFPFVAQSLDTGLEIARHSMREAPSGTCRWRLSDSTGVRRAELFKPRE